MARSLSKVKPLSDLTNFPFVSGAETLLSYSYVKERCILPLSRDGSTVMVATFCSLDFNVLEDIQHICGLRVEEVLCTKEAIEQAIGICYQKDTNETNALLKELDGVQKQKVVIDHEREYDLLAHDSPSSIVKGLNMVIMDALQQQASDIHFDPSQQGVAIRFRIDGVLQNQHVLPIHVQNQVVTRIKVLAKLDIAQHRLPQDGRIKLHMGDREVDFRVSTVPVVHGERVVLRILDRKRMFHGLDSLGMSDEVLKKFRQLVQRNQGIILVTGPTGSGKSTTLYSALSEIASPEINIMTIEDPVEFKIEQLAQISVNTKINLDFATALRHILRQDPDKIMIGEVRDRKTAEIAIQSSLTGHLVLSTLHTNDAPSALMRLTDMGLEPYLLSSAVIAVLAQRLVRKNCEHCKEPCVPTAEELAALDLAQYPAEEVTFFRGQGCKHCFQTGYKGRMGIYELMLISKGLKKQIIDYADAHTLRKIAVSEGMSTLAQEGAKLVMMGITSPEEIFRVCRTDLA